MRRVAWHVCAGAERRGAPRVVCDTCLGAHAKANIWLSSRSYSYASGVGCGHRRCLQAETRKSVGLLKLLAIGKPRAARAQLADGGKGLSGRNGETCGEDFCSWARIDPAFRAAEEAK